MTNVKEAFEKKLKEEKREKTKGGEKVYLDWRDSIVDFALEIATHTLTAKPVATLLHHKHEINLLRF